jgi:hypothetical protein
LATVLADHVVDQDAWTSVDLAHHLHLLDLVGLEA